MGPGRAYKTIGRVNLASIEIEPYVGV
jgi:hypothetical protein